MIDRRIFRRVGLALLLLALLSAPISAAAPPPSEQEAAPFVEGQVLLQVKPGVSASQVARSVGGTVLRSIGNRGIHLLKVGNGAVPAVVQALQGRPGVVFAEPNWLRQLHDAPDDSDYDLKWDLNNIGDSALCDGSDCPNADADIGWEEAYTYLSSNFDGSAIVAVIDTGIDENHPDLNDKIVPGWDYLDGDSNPADTYGHGTHVAGIALAETNNNTGTAGVGYSPNIKVMPLRVCNERGCPTDAIVSAIYHAADHGANVINLSLGGGSPSSAEEEAINYAWDLGLVIAASSGNDSATSVSYPAAFANCIAVGSTTWDDTLASYSNKGSALDVVAPGGQMSSLHDPGGIYSTMPTYSVYLTSRRFGYSTNYDQLQGTSMAAPQVAGLAGLLFAMGVNNNSEVRQIIESTVDDLGIAGWDTSFGWGRINVYNAVLSAGGGTEPTPTPTTEPTPTPTPEPTTTPEPGGTMHVSAIDMWYTRVGVNYIVYTRVTIVDEAGSPVSNATVSLQVAVPGSSTATGSAATGTDGTVTFSVKSKKTGTYTSTVTDVTHASLTYDPGANAETSHSLPVP